MIENDSSDARLTFEPMYSNISITVALQTLFEVETIWNPESQKCPKNGLLLNNVTFIEKQNQSPFNTSKQHLSCFCLVGHQHNQVHLRA